ncbi:uncharacterized protein [Medicago truncatula]|uniref:uncharacterized protein n=1 Tax=Medicago truncatula TaxID=3880 RepID=UPI001967D912|nr:uncharacterized protein LOC120578064 [Medicago truncatula]
MASLNSFIAKKILSIPISFRLPHDKVTWQWEKSGEYSVTSGHHLLCENKSKEVVESSLMRGSDIWKQIWNFNGPRSVQNFLWRLASNSLPTRCNLSKNGITLDQTFPLCNSGLEDLNHLFLHCPAAKAVWFSSPLGIHIPPNSMCREWLELRLKKDDPLAVQFFGITLWRLWQGRNQLIFKNSPFDPALIAQSAVLLVEEFNLANRKAACQPISRVPTRWCPPQTGIVKINVDAGVFTDGSTGWGFVARDHQKGSNSRACV